MIGSAFGVLQALEAERRCKLAEAKQEYTLYVEVCQRVRINPVSFKAFLVAQEEYRP